MDKEIIIRDYNKNDVDLTWKLNATMAKERQRIQRQENIQRAIGVIIFIILAIILIKVSP